MACRESKRVALCQRVHHGQARRHDLAVFSLRAFGMLEVGAMPPDRGATIEGLQGKAAADAFDAAFAARARARHITDVSHKTRGGFKAPGEDFALGGLPARARRGGRCAVFNDDRNRRFVVCSLSVLWPAGSSHERLAVWHGPDVNEVGQARSC